MIGLNIGIWDFFGVWSLGFGIWTQGYVTELTKCCTKWEVKTVVPGHGRLGTSEVLRGQRAYLADLVLQVRAGIKAGKTADRLVQEIDLAKHQPWGANPSANAGSIRAIYRRLSRPAGDGGADR